MRVFTVGVGTEKGGLVPIYDSAGVGVVDYMKDESGNPITSRLHADTLRQLAQNGRGKYYQASVGGSESALIAEELAMLKRDSLEASQIKRFSHIFQYFLGPGIALVMLSLIIGVRRVGE
jgi:Ca-activated chloride channel family protein